MEGTRNTMSHSSSQKSKPAKKPSCAPGVSHHWKLETAQDAANDGRLGTSDGVCINCNAHYTVFNSLIDYDPRAHHQLFLGRPV